MTGYLKNISRCMATSGRRESGSALIAVLCLIFTAGILTTTMIAIAKQTTFDIASHVGLQRSMYVAEGVANRAQWLLAADRDLHAPEILGETDYEEYEYDRYLADGIPHIIDYHGEKVQFTITDAKTGLDFSGSNYTGSLNRLRSGREDEPEWVDFLNVIRRRIADYTDKNDDLAEDGLEKGDYEDFGMYPLPRNDRIQYREELLYIPGFKRLFPTDRQGRLSSVRLIPPEGTVDLSGSPNLFTAGINELKAYSGNMEDDEVREIQDAIRQWHTDRTPLSESLDPLLLGKIAGRNGLSRSESGHYTIVIEAPAEAKRPFRRLAFSFTGYGVDGPKNGQFCYLEWFFF